MRPVGLPSLFELRAPDGWQAIDFISDLHLCAAQPASFEAWAAYLRATDADAVFMLGDLFEVWVGDDACAEPDSFEARGAAVLREAAARRRLAFMAGNRDFLVGRGLLDACGITALPDPTLLRAWGRAVLLSHGDLLCLDDEAYQDFRRTVRSPAWRDAFLALPLDERRRQAQAMRDASRMHQREQPAAGSDVDPASALAWLEAAGSHDLVHGHTHRPGSHVLAPGFVRHVLSDWDLDGEPRRAEVLRLTRQGFSRRAP